MRTFAAAAIKGRALFFKAFVSRALSWSSYVNKKEKTFSASTTPRSQFNMYQPVFFCYASKDKIFGTCRNLLRS
jgi:hypothetical protein